MASLTCSEVKPADNSMELQKEALVWRLESEYYSRACVCVGLQLWRSDAPQRPGEAAHRGGKVSASLFIFIANIIRKYFF